MSRLVIPMDQIIELSHFGDKHILDIKNYEDALEMVWQYEYYIRNKKILFIKEFIKYKINLKCSNKNSYKEYIENRAHFLLNFVKLSLD